MIANYHNHTVRCNHASGTEREYIEAAIAAGFREIGFSDHSPMPFENNHNSGFRMTFQQFEDYCKVLSDLKQEYRSDIAVYIGLEAEYYPKLFPKLIEKIQGHPIEYLILGQHFTRNETDGFYSGKATEDKADLVLYIDQLIEGIETGCYSYIAHPDLIHYVGNKQIFRFELTRLCTRAKELSIPMEVNFLGIWDRRHYPTQDYFDVLGEVRCDVILGCDAHSTDTAVQPHIEAYALSELAKRGITPIDRLTLVNPLTKVR